MNFNEVLKGIWRSSISKTPEGTTLWGLLFVLFGVFLICFVLRSLISLLLPCSLRGASFPNQIKESTALFSISMEAQHSFVWLFVVWFFSLLLACLFSSLLPDFLKVLPSFFFNHFLILISYHTHSVHKGLLQWKLLHNLFLFYSQK